MKRSYARLTKISPAHFRLESKVYKGKFLDYCVHKINTNIIRKGLKVPKILPHSPIDLVRRT